MSIGETTPAGETGIEDFVWATWQIFKLPGHQLPRFFSKHMAVPAITMNKPKTPNGIRATHRTLRPSKAAIKDVTNKSAPSAANAIPKTNLNRRFTSFTPQRLFCGFICVQSV